MTKIRPFACTIPSDETVILLVLRVNCRLVRAVDESGLQVRFGLAQRFVVGLQEAREHGYGLLRYNEAPGPLAAWGFMNRTRVGRANAFPVRFPSLWRS